MKPNVIKPKKNNKIGKLNKLIKLKVYAKGNNKIISISKIINKIAIK
jgi:hypothetical protein